MWWISVDGWAKICKKWRDTFYLHKTSTDRYIRFLSDELNAERMANGKKPIPKGYGVDE
jgi:hypothetical protein